MIDRDIQISKMIEWFYNKKTKEKPTYSMERRTGNGSYDCSSAIYYAVCYAFGITPNYPKNTETLHDWLIDLGFECIAIDKEWKAERGDIFIIGKKGYSAGGNGHTGIYQSNSMIYHMNYKHNGISFEKDSNLYWGKHFYCYRLKSFWRYFPTTKYNQFFKVEHGNFAIDSLPNFLPDKRLTAEAKDFLGKKIRITRKWGYYWYSPDIKGWIDCQALGYV